MTSRSLVALLALGAVAHAQPMMVDPSRMSGIPRPDPQVPPKTVTVRLIRGELANRMTDHLVELLDQKTGKVAKSKTDENGRATFADLDGGPFQARASDGDEEKVSQPIELPPNVGVRVMLVFSPTGGVGVGRPDKSVPPGTVVVRVQGAGGAPLSGVEVKLEQARAGENNLSERKAKSDAKGEARFEGLDAKPTSGYLASAEKDGAHYAGKPFRLVENMGSIVVLDVLPVSKDTSQLLFGPGSHFILEVTDDAVQVVEVLRLQNTGTTAVDVGPGGLHLPLPEKAVSAAPGPQSPPALTVAGHDAVWRGPIPPGDSELQILFVLAYQGDHVELRQSLPVAFADLAVVTEKIDGMSLAGEGVVAEERELQGRKLVLYRGPGKQAGGELMLTLLGLPHSDPTWRLIASAAALLIVIGFGVWAWREPAVTGDRARLEQNREHLLAELAALDEKEGDDPKRKKKRDELAEKLAELYRKLDEVQS